MSFYEDKGALCAGKISGIAKMRNTDHIEIFSYICNYRKRSDVGAERKTASAKEASHNHNQEN